jgi:hypothetical protein
MANSRKMLEEAIAEAKAVKEMAIASAKSSLEEAFTPHLSSMLSAKLQEMEELDEEDEMEDEMMDGDEVEEESLDLENMTDDDLKKYIEDVIGDMVERGELEAGEGEEESEDESEEEIDLNELVSEMEDEEDNLDELLAEMYEDDEYEGTEDDFMFDDESEELGNLGVGFDNFDDDFSDDSEIDLDELLAEIDLEEDDEMSLEESKIGEFWDKVKKFFKSDERNYLESLQDEVNELMAIEDPIERLEAAAPLITDFTKQQIAKKVPTGVRFANVSNLRAILKLPALGGASKGSVSIQEMQKEVEKLKNDLKEINLLNSKLLYTNKIFKEKNLNESQKLQVLKSFDKTKTIQESKLVYETLKTGLVSKSSIIKENRGSASKSITLPSKTKQIINGNDQFTRMQELAFGDNKY